MSNLSHKMIAITPTPGVPALIFVENPLELLKKVARVRLPFIAPSKRMEVVARGLGFKSFAALSSVCNEITPVNPVVLRADDRPVDQREKSTQTLFVGLYENLPKQNPVVHGAPVESSACVSRETLFYFALHAGAICLFDILNARRAEAGLPSFRDRFELEFGPSSPVVPDYIDYRPMIGSNAHEHNIHWPDHVDLTGLGQKALSTLVVMDKAWGFEAESGNFARLEDIEAFLQDLRKGQAGVHLDLNGFFVDDSVSRMTLLSMSEVE